MRKIVILTICFVFVGAMNCFAEQLLRRETRWELGSEISYIKYDEPGVMEEDGMMYGISGSCAYHERGYVVKAEGKYSYGQVDYENSGTLNDVDDHMVEIRGLLGYDYAVLKSTLLTPYIGIGYRYLMDDLSGKTTSTGARGYKRESNYLYSPIGIEAVADIKNGWSIGATAEYDLFWGGVQKSKLSGVDSNYSDLENDQKDGFGVRGSLKIGKKTDKIDWLIEPYIKYWNIKKSEEDIVTYSNVIIGFGYEPKNNSTEIGVKLAAKF